MSLFIFQRQHIASYIFIHDQEILLKYREVKKFTNLPGLKWVFVGNKAIDRIEHLPDVIISRKLKHNIEQYPMFCSFTGWYSLWKNRLIRSRYVNLFEYDTMVHRDFNRLQKPFLDEKKDFIGYIEYPMSGDQYIHTPQWVEHLIPSIQRHYNIDIVNIIQEKLRLNPAEKWACTSNSTFSLKCFNQYMQWFEKLVDDLKESRTSGAAHERSISFFCFSYKKDMALAPGLLSHIQMDSHKMCGLNVDVQASMRKLLDN